MSVKYKYWCQDCDCGLIGSQKDFVIEKEESQEERVEKCPNNKKKKLKLMGSFSYPKTTMNKEQRVESLKKRSKNHFNRVVKEQKVDMIRNSTPKR